MKAVSVKQSGRPLLAFLQMAEVAKGGKTAGQLIEKLLRFQAPSFPTSQGN